MFVYLCWHLFSLNPKTSYMGDGNQAKPGESDWAVEVFMATVVLMSQGCLRSRRPKTSGS